MNYLSRYSLARDLRVPVHAVRGVLLLAMLVTVMGCSPSGPSEADVKGLVRAQLEHVVPPSLVKPVNSEDFAGMQSGKDAVINEIRVIDIGQVRNYGGGDYWPVKVYVEGKCTTMFSAVVRQFAGEIDYDIYRNSSGEWVVRSAL